MREKWFDYYFKFQYRDDIVKEKIQSATSFNDFQKPFMRDRSFFTNTDWLNREHQILIKHAFSEIIPRIGEYARIRIISQDISYQQRKTFSPPQRIDENTLYIPSLYNNNRNPMKSCIIYIKLSLLNVLNFLLCLLRR